MTDVHKTVNCQTITGIVILFFNIRVHP